jgi:chemotaxis protein MotA
MLFIIGMVVVFGSVVTGYLMHHGKLEVLWQPNEFVIIIGAAIGSFLISNPADILKDALKNLKNLFKGKPYKKVHYLELLSFLFHGFKQMKTKGMLTMEAHIENPHESELFKKYPGFLNNHHALEFFCDSIRLLVMGVDNPYILEDIMDKEIEIHHHEGHNASAAVGGMGEAMPALGIVAAVLGVITTMKSISEPPEILGGLIAAALVGTFTGVLLSYGVLSPISSFIGKFSEAEEDFLKCIKAGIISHMQGNAPAITVEFVRKVIPLHDRPTFRELEAALNAEEEAK